MSDAPSPPEGSAEPAGPNERFTLRVPPTFGPRFFVTVAMAVGLVVLLFAQPLIANGENLYLLVLLVAATVVPGIVAVMTASGQRRHPLSIEVLADRVHLPTTGPGRLAVRYRSISGLLLQRRGFGGFLYIATPERELLFPLRAFPGNEAERLLRAIRTRIHQSEPDGERRLGHIDRLAEVARRAYSRRPVVVIGTVAIMAALHIFLMATDRLVGVLDVASMGAVSPELVDVGGPYLAFTSHWVHGWRFQPFLILPGLFVVGTLVERLLGHGAAALSILASATLGGLAAAYFPGAPLHAGALIPAAGLVGTLAFTAQRYRGRMPIGFRLSGQWWAWVGTLAAVAGLVHGVSVPGVLLGLLAGVIVAAVLTERDPELPLWYSPRWSAAVAGLLGVVHVGAAGWAMTDLQGRGLELEEVAVQHLSDARRLNEYAWQLAVFDESPPKERLELALVAAKRSVGLEDHALLRLTRRDTQATVLHRLGRHREAVELEREVLEERPDLQTSATQLARFLEAMLAAEGGLVLPGVNVHLESAKDPSAARYIAHVALDDPLPEPLVLYAPVRSKDGLGALLRVPLPAGTRSSTAAVRAVEEDAQFPDDLEVVPAWTAPGQASGKIWPMASTILAFP